MTLTGADMPTGADLIAKWAFRGNHAYLRECPGCGQDASVVAIVELAYTFRSCDCGTPTYGHLVEQVWHLACLKTIDLR